MLYHLQFRPELKHAYYSFLSQDDENILRGELGFDCLISSRMTNLLNLLRDLAKIVIKELNEELFYVCLILMLYHYHGVQNAVVCEVANVGLNLISLVSFPNDLIVDIENVNFVFKRILILGQN